MLNDLMRAQLCMCFGMAHTLLLCQKQVTPPTSWLQSGHFENGIQAIIIFIKKKKNDHCSILPVKHLLHMYIIQICISRLTSTLHECTPPLNTCLIVSILNAFNRQNELLQCQIQKSRLNAPPKYELVSHGK